jgi:hypothetical protein
MNLFEQGFWYYGLLDWIRLLRSQRCPIIYANGIITFVGRGDSLSHLVGRRTANDNKKG